MEYVENPMAIGDYPYYQSQEDYEKEMRKQNRARPGVFSG